jgi:hypothetical protein
MLPGGSTFPRIQSIFAKQISELQRHCGLNPDL